MSLVHSLKLMFEYQEYLLTLSDEELILESLNPEVLRDDMKSFEVFRFMAQERWKPYKEYLTKNKK